jgi:hypothetical protein
MPRLPTSPGPSGPPTGSSKTKAERLFEMSLPDGPEFPLDEDILDELEGYPGELPTTAQRFCELLPAPPPGHDLDG